MGSRRWVAAVVVAALVGAAGAAAARRPPERLFLALQIIDDEAGVLARPMLLAESERPLSMSLVDARDPTRIRLALRLLPEREGSSWRVRLSLDVPGRLEGGEADLVLGHAEERDVAVGPRGARVRILLMRVKSPEFDAFMRLGTGGAALPES